MHGNGEKSGVDASTGCEAAVPIRPIIVWVKLLCEKLLNLKLIVIMVYRSSVRLVKCCMGVEHGV